MPPKRKRGERISEGGGGRPAPHRPSDTSLGQHDRDFQDGNPSQNRRGSGGGRSTRRNADRRDSSNNRGPVFLRSYVNQTMRSLLPEVKLWEAARATGAAPGFWDSIEVGDYTLVDGGLGAMNPLGW